MLNQELSETIVSDLRCSGGSTQEYAAQRIEELESALSSTRAEADALEAAAVHYEQVRDELAKKQPAGIIENDFLQHTLDILTKISTGIRAMKPEGR